jgi:hypothetical protein
MTFRTTQLLTLILLGALLLTTPAIAQMPYGPPAQPMAPYGQGQATPPPYPQPPQQSPGQYAPQAPSGQPYPGAQQQQPMRYAFRPELSNQQYGECLGLERNWKNLWQQYAQGYRQAQSMNTSDPRYVQMTYYLANLRSQVDAAWNAFSGKCIYFRSR